MESLKASPNLMAQSQRVIQDRDKYIHYKEIHLTNNYYNTEKL